MDRTRRQAHQAREAKKKVRVQQAAEEEAAHLDQLVLEACERVEATKAAKLRSAESRRILEELQSELADDQSDQGEDE